MMIDEIINNGLILSADSEKEKFLFRKTIENTIVFDIDNVATYVWNELARVNVPSDLIKIQDVVNMAPPFEAMWFEFYVHCEKITNVSKTGIYMVSLKTSNGWDIKLQIYCRRISGEIVYLGWADKVHIESNGHLNPYRRIGSEQHQLVAFQAENPNASLQQIQEWLIWQVDVYIRMIGIAISFMHCKNIIAISHEYSLKLQKKRQKQNRKALVKYHTLEISSMTKILREEGNIEKTGIKQALHICRGHFKDYRDGRGLFGKYQGLYWWEDQVRGNKSEGIVIKDYKINPPLNQ